jgi:hypothetical protein
MGNQKIDHIRIHNIQGCVCQFNKIKGGQRLQMTRGDLQMRSGIYLVILGLCWFILDHHVARDKKKKKKKQVRDGVEIANTAWPLLSTCCSCNIQCNARLCWISCRDLRSRNRVTSARVKTKYMVAGGKFRSRVPPTGTFSVFERRQKGKPTCASGENWLRSPVEAIIVVECGSALVNSNLLLPSSNAGACVFLFLRTQCSSERDILETLREVREPSSRNRAEFFSFVSGREGHAATNVRAPNRKQCQKAVNFYTIILHFIRAWPWNNDYNGFSSDPATYEWTWRRFLWHLRRSFQKRKSVMT